MIKKNLRHLADNLMNLSTTRKREKNEVLHYTFALTSVHKTAQEVNKALQEKLLWRYSYTYSHTAVV